jgi:hypothetical protein
MTWERFFNSEEERDLWLRLIAEEQIQWEKNLRTPNGQIPTQARYPRSLDSALDIANIQLIYDMLMRAKLELEHGYLRDTIEEMIENGKSEFAKQLKRERKLNILLS